MAEKKSIELKRRTTKDIPIVAKNLDGTPFNLTGCTIYFTVKKNPTDDDSAAAIRKVITNVPSPANGSYTLTLSVADTDITPYQYSYDFKLKDSNGKVGASETGQFEVKQDITHSTS